MIHTSCELMRIKRLLEELRFDVKMTMPMYCHNQVAVHIASNFVFHERTKHIEIDFHIVWERVKSGVIFSSYTSTGLPKLYVKHVWIYYVTS